MKQKLIVLKLKKSQYDFIQNLIYKDNLRRIEKKKELFNHINYALKSRRTKEEVYEIFGKENVDYVIKKYGDKH